MRTKGEGKFERITWDEALAEVAHCFKAVLAAQGGEAIPPYSYGGSLSTVHRRAGRRFFHCPGASRLEGMICDPAATAGWEMTLGKHTSIALT